VSGPVVVFDGVSKKFRRGERHDSLRDLIPSLARRMFGRRASRELESPDDFWAVRDVSFEVARGEALGIIGPNGAGKSTTLKLLTRILRPTRGYCHIRGKVGALIEVAAGFHPDLTGRENVFLQGAIMGMRRPEITKKLDAIIDFAGVSDFIDTPVKRYSSGMNARLGFSIAANLEPDALIIDEVLSVGDMAFQQRCIDRMRDFKRAGTAIVFVSHNLQAVVSLCDRALHLKGSVQALGRPEEVLAKYVTSQSSSQEGSVVHLDTVSLAQASGQPADSVPPGEPLTLTVRYTAARTVSDVMLGFLVYRSTDHLLVYDSNFEGRELGIESLTAGNPLTVRFNFRPHLTRGQYHVLCHMVHSPTQEVLGMLEPAALFSVVEHRTYAGVADLEVDASVTTARERGVELVSSRIGSET
jgi:lipopolysaccharide transport system ATP-binding protein